jgi:twitching motility protein PilT
MARIDTYFRELKERGASDLHMVIDFPPLIRLNGELRPLDHPVLTPEDNRDLLFEILTPEQQEHLENNRDFDMAYELGDEARFRCNFFYQHRGIGAVFRIIPTKILSLEQLNLPEVLKVVAQLKQGLVLVTGPTGSGKSTTLAAVIDYINETRDAHIITIEDPLEFIHPNKKCLFTQREIGAHARPSRLQAVKILILFSWVRCATWKRSLSHLPVRSSASSSLEHSTPTVHQKLSTASLMLSLPSSRSRHGQCWRNH